MGLICFKGACYLKKERQKDRKGAIPVLKSGTGQFRGPSTGLTGPKTRRPTSSVSFQHDGYKDFLSGESDSCRVGHSFNTASLEVTGLTSQTLDGVDLLVLSTPVPKAHVATAEQSTGISGQRGTEQYSVLFALTG